ncbi:MAG: amidohydrolase family protein [Candidatus Harrisonbacteria bacterium]|nr:amidohydrolase family protein [Candidatus Harrisonbacteria bacterium]
MILIKNAQIIDGTGKPPFKGDILIKDDKISAIGTFPNQRAETVIDGLGLTATPGFIDPYATSDHYLTLFTNPLQPDFLLQGVTTIIGGHCGSSLAPLLYGSLKSIRKWGNPNQINIDWLSLKELKNTLRRLKIGVNFGTLAGHSTIRRDLIGEEIRDLTQSELELFQAALKQALQEGALGFSTGLSYSHSRHVSYSEIKNLLAAINGKGIYGTHLRNEKEDLIESVQETIKIAAETGTTTIISHFRPIIGFENQFQEALQLIQKNLGASNIYFQVNPFAASILPIYTLLPGWAQNGNLELMLENISEPNQRRQIIQDLNQANINFESMVIGEAQDNNYLIGKTLKEFSETRELSPADGLLVLMEITRMKALIFYPNINSAMATEAVLNPRSLIGSNSASLPAAGFALKPEKSTQTFPKFLEIAASKNVPLEEAIKKITLVPAKIFGLQKRGALAEGWFADLVMLKENQIVNVIVNGRLTIQDGKLTGESAGVPI